MDISDEDMAKLVLGYLRSEKCKGAAKMFLHSSRHLHDVQSSMRRSKHFITHKHGYSLREILREYAKLYTIIIEYMEDICFTSDIARDMPSKLVYLLETATSRQSYTPSLSPRSRSSTPIKQLPNSKLVTSQNLSRIDENSPSHNDVNTTPLHDLPGHFSSNNTSEEKRQKSTEESDLTDNNDNEGSIAQVLVETVLENREFQEKLAENINSIIQKPSDEKVIVENTPVNNELDSAIKAIVDKTEHDAIFERLLNDLIGPERKSEHDIQQKEKSNQEEGQSDENLNPPNLINSNQIEVKSTPIKRSMLTLEGTKVEIPPKQNLTVNTNTGDVILYDGTLENYIKEQPTNSQSTTTSVNSSCSSNVMLNTGLLMVQPQSIQQPQSYYFWNGSQVVNVGSQVVNVGPQYKVNNLSEQDILTMPTIIVCDENQQEHGVSKNTEEINGKTFKKIAPKVNSMTPMMNLSKKKKKPRRKSPRKHCYSPKTPRIQQTQQIQENEKKIEIKIEVLKDSQNQLVINDQKNPIDSTQFSNNHENDNEKIESKLNSKKTPKEATPKNELLHDETTSTPRSGSHVRILDFDFTPKTVSKQIKKQQSGTSPKRKSPSVKTSHQPTKISKSLFTSPGKNPQRRKSGGDNEKKGVKRSWDADLRALAASSTLKQSPKKEKSKRKPKKPDNLNKTEQDAKAIEDNLKAVTDEITNNKEEIGAEKSQETATNEKKNLTEDCAEIVIQAETETRCVEEEVTEEEGENTFTLINYNRAPRIKRKCNIDGNVKKVGKVTKVKEVKNLDVCNNKMILSPSKLNASKRTFVEKVDENEKNKNIDNKNNIEDKNIIKSDKDIEKEVEKVKDNLKVPLTPRVYGGSFQDNDILTLNFSKLTPENVPAITVFDDSVMKATRNLLPLLETPLKPENNHLLIPNTPRIISPVSIKDTPLTKMFKEQLEGIDLSDIQTPKFPITPNLLITPLNQYVNRPTDYSTSSSYYQPSDTEQNKSIEQLIEETRKVSNKNVSKKITDEKEDNHQIDHQLDNRKENDDKNLKNIEKGDEISKESPILTSIVNKLSNFNRHVIGKKNLSLVSKADTVSFGDSESENDFESEDESLWGSKKNATVIQNDKNAKEGGKSRYSLRSRSKEIKNEKEVKKLEKIIENDIKTDVKNDLDSEKIKNKNDLSEKDEEIIEKNKELKLLDPKDKILKELEKKRQETIAMIKKPEIKSIKNLPKKNIPKINLKKESNLNVNKESVDNKKLGDEKKPIESKKLQDINKNENKKSVKPKHIPKPIKQIIKKSATQKKELITTKKVINIGKNENDTKKEVKTKVINISSKNDLNLINPLNFVEAQLGNSNDNKKEYESIQELLVRDLKERGIYLLPKHKKDVVLEPPDDNSSTELINLEIKSVLPPKKRDSNKSFEIINHEQEKNQNLETNLIKQEEHNIENENNLKDDLNLTDSLTEEKDPIIFSANLKLLDYIIFHETNDENDENNKKTLKDYDLKCLEKTYNVPVYWEEYKLEDSRPLKVSKIDFFFDLESKISDVEPPKQQEKTIKILEDVTLKKKFNPLECLYTQLLKNNTTVTPIDNFQSRSSPLDNLYETDKNVQEESRDVRLKCRRKSDEVIKKPMLISTRKTNRSESVDDGNMKSKKKSTDLMDFAIMGGDEASGSGGLGLKRKAGEEVESEKTKCPKMCDNILSGLNVEHFLSQIHKD